MNETKIIYYDLPCSVKGFVKETPDSDYFIVLNSRLNWEQNSLTLDHELWHIKNGDIKKECSVTEIEYKLHKIET